MDRTETNAHLYGALNNLERENSDLRQRLARHEFRQMERELRSDTPFALEIHGEGPAVPGDAIVPDAADLPLPRLSVPMGTIHGAEPASALPVICVYDDGLTGVRLAAALMGLMNTQYRAPFARLVFISASFEAVPFLTRYGFAVEHIGRTKPETVMERLHRRYGAGQIRSLDRGTMIAETSDT